MLQWLLARIDGPIISRIVAAFAGGIVSFLTVNMHLTLDPSFQTTLTGTLSMLAYALVHSGIVTGSAASGNAVTSTIAANAHPGDS